MTKKYKHKRKGYELFGTLSNKGFVRFKKPHKQNESVLREDIFLGMFEEV